MAGGDHITVQVEWLARHLAQQEEDAAATEQHRTMVNSVHRVSRVPYHVREHNKDAYTSGLVAIGPLHTAYALQRLRAGHRLKMAYLHSLISRGHSDGDGQGHLTVIQRYVRLVAAREREARAMYAAKDMPYIRPEDLVQMLVLDGCFIIEHLVNVAMGREEPSLHATPFGPAQLSVRPRAAVRGPRPRREPDPVLRPRRPPRQHQAAGVRLRGVQPAGPAHEAGDGSKGKATGGITSVLGPVPLGVKLAHDELLRLSQLRIEFRTAPLLLNLMAFEQSTPTDQRAGDVSAYVWFLAKLVQSAEDAALLLASEVVVHSRMTTVSQIEDVARFFRQVGAASEAAGETMEKSYLGKTLGELRRRSRRKDRQFVLAVQRKNERWKGVFCKTSFL